MSVVELEAGREEGMAMEKSAAVEGLVADLQGLQVERMEQEAEMVVAVAVERLVESKDLELEEVTQAEVELEAV